jgi:hypothetical protein
MTPDLMNDWILDAESRQSWMRLAALTELSEHLLGCGMAPVTAIECLLDEVLGTSRTRRSPARALASAVEQARPWIQRELKAARRKGRAFRSLGFNLSDGAPHRVGLSGVRGEVSARDAWEHRIVFQSDRVLAPGLLGKWLEAFAVPTSARLDFELMVPLTLTAFVVREALSAHADITHAVVSYDGGDSIDVPLKRPLAR